MSHPATTSLRIKRFLHACRSVAGAAVAACCLSISSCAPRGESGSPNVDAPGTVSPDAETVARFIEGHNRRVRLLGKISARGVIEFRWVDEEGAEHFEPQVDAKLRIELPRRSALRASKVGEELLWIGSDDDGWWLFDLMNEEKVVYVGRHDEEASGPGASPLLIRPLALLDLLALTRLPQDIDPAQVRADSDRQSWVFHVDGAGGPMRLHLDQSGGLPVRVETLTSSGELVLFSELRRHRSVVVPGVSRAALPRMPTLIDITDPAGALAVKLALDEPTGDIGDGPWDRFFNLARLIKALRPDVVEGALPPEAAAP